MEDRTSQLDRSCTWFKMNHKMKISNFSSTFNLEDLIDWIGELEDYFELEFIGDLSRVRLA